MPFEFLSSTYPLRDYYFCVPKLCLGSMGFWPATYPTTRQTLWAFANFAMLFICVFTELHAGIGFLRYDLELALDTLCPAGTSAVTLLKISLICYYRADLQRVLQRMRRMLYGALDGNDNAVHLTAVKEDIIRAHAIMAARLNFIPYVMGFITCTSYNLKPLLMSLILLSQGEEAEWKMPFNLTLPSFLLRAPYFPLTYIYTAYTGYITIFSYGGCDAFYFEFCSNTAALLKILQEDIKTIFEKCDGLMALTPEQSAEFEQQLIGIIRRHNDIIDLTHYFRKRYTIITVAHFVSASVVIGVSIFDLMMFSGFGIIIYIGYTIAVLGQLFIYCYGGGMVAESSANVALVVAACDWHCCSPRLRRMVLLIIIRAQRAITMSVPFFSPSLVTFTAILQTAGSIIALASSFQ